MPILLDFARGVALSNRLFAHQALLWLDAQVQFQLPTDAIDVLVIPCEASDIAQIQETQAEAPVALIVHTLRANGNPGYPETGN